MSRIVGLFILLLPACALHAQAGSSAAGPTVLHAAHLLDVARGTLVSPGEVLVGG